jgi:hypothetical protein
MSFASTDATDCSLASSTYIDTLFSKRLQKKQNFLQNILLQEVLFHQ